MATLEERLQALEQDNASRKKFEERLTQENAELKQKFELHTIAIGGLVNKAMLESISEKNDKIFKAIEDHGRFTNAQIAELRGKIEDDIEGKIVGMQTEMRQSSTQVEARFDQVEARFTQVEARFDQVETRFTQVEATLHEHTTALVEQKNLLNEILARLPEKP